MFFPTRTHLTYNNDKPWFTAKLRQLRQVKEDAYRKGDKVLYKQAKYTLEKEIRVAKMNYSGKLRNKLCSATAVESFRFLGTTISQDLKWENYIKSIVKKAQLKLYFLWQLRKFNLPQKLLKQFYSTIIESVLCTSITFLVSSATKSDLRRLRRLVRTAERIIGTTLPTLQELYSSRVKKGLAKLLWTPHIQHTPSLNCYRLVNVTEL